MKAITRQWLDAAYDDLQTIVKLIHETTLSNIVAFHAQQVIEKTFKAYIEEQNIHLPKTHDLLRLHKLSNLTITATELTVIEVLNDLYVSARYPGELGLLPGGKTNSFRLHQL